MFVPGDEESTPPSAIGEPAANRAARRRVVAARDGVALVQLREGDAEELAADDDRAFEVDDDGTDRSVLPVSRRRSGWSWRTRRPAACWGR